MNNTYYNSIIFAGNGDNTARNALAKLALRRGAKPPLKTWWDYADEISYNKKCSICDQVFITDIDDGFKIFAEHGLQHLKEHNLLSFI